MIISTSIFIECIFIRCSLSNDIETSFKIKGELRRYYLKLDTNGMHLQYSPNFHFGIYL